ncbi:U-actitoxin-Avd3i, partial [Varanus komodoensis]
MSQPMALLLLVLGLLMPQIKPLGASDEEEILFLSPPGPYPSICKLPRAVGRCRASFHRYYFDISTEKCIPFTYGGCRGNANNFLSAQGCYLVCKIF